MDIKSRFPSCKTRTFLINCAPLFSGQCFGFAAIFASSLIWSGTNLYFQFIYQGFGWQTLILFILVTTFIFNFIVFLSNLFGKDVLGTVGKKRLLLMYAICLVLLIIAAALETWYCGISAGYLHSRFIAVTIFNWLLVVSYIALLVVTILFV
ncbi:unnamed protein product [Cylicocyclus nassatus]|uniref:Uncharacterized protein n=1 Tax=Cylicocyclus nassatus TaxID=53992 RepID=A0AA36HFP3_CYLNA|nr:unnamed protein product [Cylicocyclus nassatus]